RSWPILVIVDGVNHGHFLWNFLRFRWARHDLPFILVAPLVVSNSGTPNPHDYSYRPEVWSQAAAQGAVGFEAAGVLAIVDEVQHTYTWTGHLLDDWLVSRRAPDLAGDFQPSGAAGRCGACRRQLCWPWDHDHLDCAATRPVADQSVPRRK